MKNKRWLILGTGVLVMVLTTAGYAVSGFKSHFREHGKEHVQEKILSHMDYTMQELNLTADQQAEYAVIRAKMGASIEGSFNRHEVVHDTMKAEMDKPNPDLKAMGNNLKKEIRSMPDHLNVKIDYMLEVYDILDDNQKKQLVQMIKDHMHDKESSCS